MRRTTQVVGGEETRTSQTGPKNDLRVCWLTPDKPANISVGRRRIAAHLERSDIEVVLRGTTVETVAETLRDSEGFDAVIGTTRAGAIAGALVARVKKCPLIVDHVDPIRQFEQTASRPVATIVRWLETLVFTRAAHALYVYPEERSRVERFVAHSTKTDLGVEFDRFANPSSEAIRAAETRLDEAGVGGRVAIYLGGLEPIYHVSELLESTRILDDWTLVVVGDGSLSGLVERTATESERIAFLESVPHEDVPGYLHLADVGVCLVDDPYTLKVLEYGAASLPVVQLAGRAEDRFEGLVDFCTTDPADIAQAIEAADERSTDADRGRESDSNSLRAFARRYDWARVAADYERVLNEVTERDRA